MVTLGYALMSLGRMQWPFVPQGWQGCLCHQPRARKPNTIPQNGGRQRAVYLERMASTSSGVKRRAGRVLAIDYGRRRLGLALSDELGMLARPLATLERASRGRELGRLAKIAGVNGVVHIVVGLPLRLDGSAGEMAKEARAFAARIEKALGLPVELVDERLTSWDAAKSIPRGKAAAKRRGEIDQFAAVLILEEYLRREPARI